MINLNMQNEFDLKKSEIDNNQSYRKGEKTLTKI